MNCAGSCIGSTGGSTSGLVRAPSCGVVVRHPRPWSGPFRRRQTPFGWRPQRLRTWLSSRDRPRRDSLRVSSRTTSAWSCGSALATATFFLAQTWKNRGGSTGVGRPLSARIPFWDSYADVFKVPHHGSKTGHCDAVWQDLLKSRPFALVTPYTRQVRPLPTPADRIRIRAATENAYTTATEIETTVIERSRGVQKFLSRAGRQPVVRSARGQIRLRASASVGSWSVETHPPAGRL